MASPPSPANLRQELIKQLIPVIICITALQLAACLPAGISNPLYEQIASFNQTFNLQPSKSLSVRELNSLSTFGHDADIDKRALSLCSCFASSSNSPYDQSIQKGHRLQCQCEAPTEQVTQSPVNSLSQLTESGWDVSYNIPVDMFVGLGPAFAYYSITPSVGIQQSKWKHQRESVNGGIRVPRTDAAYFNVFDPQGGYILALDNRSPQYQLGYLSNPKYPAVKQWSDVAFVEWQKQAAEQNADIKNLNFIFRCSIINHKTIAVINQAFGEAGEGPGPFPGAWATMTEEEGLALLGTPNGAGVAYLLSTHKEQLGQRKVIGVRVWRAPDAIYPTFMLFQIGPV